MVGAFWLNRAQHLGKNYSDSNRAGCCYREACDRRNRWNCWSLRALKAVLRNAFVTHLHHAADDRPALALEFRDTLRGRHAREFLKRNERRYWLALGKVAQD